MVVFLLQCAVSLVQIREELRANGIDVYPQKEFDEDAEDRLINDKIRVGSLGVFKPQHGGRGRSMLILLSRYLFCFCRHCCLCASTGCSAGGTWDFIRGKTNI
jgi:hypothetical protein